MQLQELNVKNKKVLVRVDFNVPLDEENHIIDATRIKATLPTIQYILDQGGSVILMSHLGRPKGKKEPRYSLKPCSDALAKLLNRPVQMAPDCIGDKVTDLVKKIQPGQILLLENLRFYQAEEKPESDPSFAKQLAELGDCYVNDAFGAAHRKHSSTYTITQYFPGRAAQGFLLEKEVHFLAKLLQNPERPFYALVGGAKISSKLAVLHSLLTKVDALFIGGAMTYTFMAAKNIPIGNSLYEPELIGEALKILQSGKTIYLPSDIVTVTKEGKIGLAFAEVGLKENEEGMDIGPMTLSSYKEKLKLGKTLFWNGPFGRYEDKRFAKGTQALLEQFASMDAITIVGGGDLVAAANSAHPKGKITHISTGGGATLEYIEKGTLPGIEVLNS